MKFPRCHGGAAGTHENFGALQGEERGRVFFRGLRGLSLRASVAADANNAGLWLELDAILAVVIGGTPLTGGRFYLASSLVGAILIQALTTTILTRGVPVEFTLVVKALVIIVVCLLQSETFRRKIRRPSRQSP